MIDIVELKKEIKEGKLKVYIEGAFIYCENCVGERVVIGTK